VKVVAQRVDHEAQIAGRLALAVQPSVGSCSGLVRLVRAALVFETADALVISTAILAHKALLARKGLSEHAVHAEVFARGQRYLSALCTTRLNNSIIASYSSRHSQFFVNTVGYPHCLHGKGKSSAHEVSSVVVSK
jgi:hypothetical protein